MGGFRVDATFRANASRSRQPTAQEHSTGSELRSGCRLQLHAFSHGEGEKYWPLRLPLEVVQRGNLHGGALGRVRRMRNGARASLARQARAHAAGESLFFNPEPRRNQSNPRRTIVKHLPNTNPTATEHLPNTAGI